MNSNNINLIITKSIQAFEAGRIEESKKNILLAIKLDPKNFFTLSYAGFICAVQKRPAEAKKFLTKATELNPGDKTAIVNLIKAHIDLNEYELALKHLEKTNILFPNDPEIHYLKAKSFSGLRQLDESYSYFKSAINLNPDYPEALSELGNLLCDMKRQKEALQYYDRAIDLQPNNYEIWLNKGTALNHLKEHTQAITYYDKIISIQPNLAEAWMNKGKTLYDLKHYDAAIKHFKETLRIKPKLAEAWFNLGSVLMELEQTVEAANHFEKAINLNPDMDYITGDFLNTKTKLCDWGVLKKFLPIITATEGHSKLVVRPFPLLGLIDDPRIQLDFNKKYVANQFSTRTREFNKFNASEHKRIKVAYLSPDFRQHPVSFLMAEVLESHNPEVVETFGFYFGPNCSDEMHKRVSSAFHHFYDVGHLEDHEICALLISLEIDIAVDLAGHTKDSRGNIFSNRCAPIQVNYIGYPGTTGADYMDYIIADKIVIPEEFIRYYSEKPVYMPNCFQANDSKRQIANAPISKEFFGLPADKFVFCNFNSNYKLNPTIFNQWAIILKSVEESVLWLISESPANKANIIKEMISRGVNANRLFFADRVEYSLHLARYRAADLFLDTLPFNGGATTSDALWAGLPVLTQTGNSFAGRMATSLICALKAPELVSRTQDEYIQKAITLAKNPINLKAVRDKIATNKGSVTLFDGKTFCKHLEIAYMAMYDRYQAGLVPDAIDVKNLI
jgi:predicted O-linked N-acetylglucosamine transferase (SPINDLY family)